MGRETELTYNCAGKRPLTPVIYTSTNPAYIIQVCLATHAPMPHQWWCWKGGKEDITPLLSDSLGPS